MLLTARQPFTSPKAQDPMEVMRRIVDERWPIRYAPYMSEESKDLVSRLLERKPVKRIGCFQGRAADIKKHPWFKVRGSGWWWLAVPQGGLGRGRYPRTCGSSRGAMEGLAGWRGGENISNSRYSLARVTIICFPCLPPPPGFT